MNKSKLDNLLHEPLLHFLLIGAVLFFIYDMQNENVVDNNHIVISEAKIDHLITLWEKNRQRLPTQVELNSMIEQQVREEVMYREALAMGLDKDDAIVRKRLAQKFDFISSDISASTEPTNKQLTEYLNTHPEKFGSPATISFEQIYFSKNKRGNQTRTDALNLLRKLREPDAAIDTQQTGDAFMMGQQQDKITEYGVSRLFGKDFAAEVFSLSAGEWQGPVESSYGVHLIRINSTTAAQAAELNRVRDKVRIEWQSEQRRTINDLFYQNLRQRYNIVIEEKSGGDNIASTP